jgi:hypothetical protein
VGVIVRGRIVRKSRQFGTREAGERRKCGSRWKIETGEVRGESGLPKAGGVEGQVEKAGGGEDKGPGQAEGEVTLDVSKGVDQELSRTVEVKGVEVSEEGKREKVRRKARLRTAPKMRSACRLS